LASAHILNGVYSKSLGTSWNKKGGAIFIAPPLVFRPQYAGVGIQYMPPMPPGAPPGSEGSG